MVVDLTGVPPVQLIAAIAELEGVLVQEIRFVWASIPCETAVWCAGGGWWW